MLETVNEIIYANRPIYAQVGQTVVVNELRLRPKAHFRGAVLSYNNVDTQTRVKPGIAASIVSIVPNRRSQSLCFVNSQPEQ